MLFTDEGDGDDDGRSSARSVPILKTKNGIVLSPQPHDDPNDPLVRPCPADPASYCSFVLCLGVMLMR
jgi:hypothetical protein